MQIFLSTQNVKNNNVNFKNTKKQVVKSTLKNINYNNKTKLTIVQYFSLLKEGFSFRDIAGFYSYNENELEQVLKNAKEEFYRASGLSRELLYSEKNQRKFYTDTKFFVVKDNDYVCEDDLWCYTGSRNFNKKRKRIEKYQFHNLIREFKDLSQMKKELGIKDVKNLVQEINKYPDLVDDYTQMLILKNHIINFLRSPAKLQKLNSNIDINDNNDNNVNESLKIESTRSEKALGIEESGKDDMRIFFNGDGSYVEIPSKTITKEIIKEYTFHLRKGFRKFIVKSPEEIENLIETYKSLAEICAAANIKNPKSFLAELNKYPDLTKKYLQIIEKNKNNKKATKNTKKKVEKNQKNGASKRDKKPSIDSTQSVQLSKETSSLLNVNHGQNNLNQLNKKYIRDIKLMQKSGWDIFKLKELLGLFTGIEVMGSNKRQGNEIDYPNSANQESDKSSIDENIVSNSIDVNVGENIKFPFSTSLLMEDIISGKTYLEMGNKYGYSEEEMKTIIFKKGFLNFYLRIQPTITDFLRERFTSRVLAGDNLVELKNEFMCGNFVVYKYLKEFNLLNIYQKIQGNISDVFLYKRTENSSYPNLYKNIEVKEAWNRNQDKINSNDIENKESVVDKLVSKNVFNYEDKIYSDIDYNKLLKKVSKATQMTLKQLIKNIEAMANVLNISKEYMTQIAMAYPKIMNLSVQNLKKQISINADLLKIDADEYIKLAINDPSLLLTSTEAISSLILKQKSKSNISNYKNITTYNIYSMLVNNVYLDKIVTANSSLLKMSKNAYILQGLQYPGLFVLPTKLLEFRLRNYSHILEKSQEDFINDEMKKSLHLILLNDLDFCSAFNKAKSVELINRGRFIK